MKALTGFLLLIAVGTAFAVDRDQIAPSVVGETSDGSSLDLEQLRGRVVLVDFWASWCAPCAVALPEYQKIQEKFSTDRFVVVAVNVDKASHRSKALQMVKQMGLSFPVVIDASHSWAESFSPPTMPSSYLIDRQGRIVQVFEGFRIGEELEIEASIRRELGRPEA